MQCVCYDVMLWLWYFYRKNGYNDSSQISQWLHLIPPWLLSFARSSHLVSAQVYNILHNIPVRGRGPEQYSVGRMEGDGRGAFADIVSDAPRALLNVEEAACEADSHWGEAEEVTSVGPPAFHEVEDKWTIDIEKLWCALNRNRLLPFHPL